MEDHSITKLSVVVMMMMMVVKGSLVTTTTTILPHRGVPQESTEGLYSSTSTPTPTGVLLAVLQDVTKASCTVVVITDSFTSPQRILEEFMAAGVWFGVVLLQEEHLRRANNTSQGHHYLLHLIERARQVRQSNTCVSVVAVSDDPSFWASFGYWSVRGRLLVWQTRMVVVTRLPLPELQALVNTSWTFTMMNTLMLIGAPQRWEVYRHLPYTNQGAQVVRMAIWRPTDGLNLLHGHQLFSYKFSNFHGAKVNVTALPYKPYWIEEEEEEKIAKTSSSKSKTSSSNSKTSSKISKKYSGADWLLLESMSEALNFTINVLPVKSWDEVVMMVEERTSFVASVVHLMLRNRVERYGFTCSYEHDVNLAFGMAKPLLRPRWESLYYPLGDEVWGACLLVLLIYPSILLLDHDAILRGRVPTLPQEFGVPRLQEVGGAHVRRGVGRGRTDQGGDGEASHP
ncbi:putative Glutamate receptor ionotropic, delta-1-like 42 [Homarus americanus]|uniref:Putative Glutamate receptor ionotropic, delta-1-like 42 n=1 Tax=Homarus americanus TaxID=6706 RepID=A0A8J5KDP0_HOMAM|nr:putative Glutamate receptor ionotropic, delta-1-like 42 [Homarus americanus]